MRTHHIPIAIGLCFTFRLSRCLAPKSVRSRMRMHRILITIGLCFTFNLSTCLAPKYVRPLLKVDDACAAFL